MKHIRLSPSTLSLYRECPRCFWLQMNERVKRPRGIFPSLPGGMDLVIKKYFDNYRGSLPPEMKGAVDGVLMEDMNTLERWRNWRTGLSYEDKERNAGLFGALDDCLVLNGGKYVPLDYKTKGSAPKEGDSQRYYGHQMDAYSFLLRENGYTVGDVAYLAYYYPKEVHEGGLVQFAVEPVCVDTDTKRARTLFEGAVDFLRGEAPLAWPKPRAVSRGEAPLSHTEASCEYCVWHNGILALDD